MKQSIIALKNIVKTSTATFLLLISLSSCGTLRNIFWGKPKGELPMDTSDREIIQLAQAAFNNDNFKLANYYYNILLQRYGNNTVDYVIGNYEIAHIAIRKKDYTTAVPLLNEVLSIYDDTPTGYLPAAYKVLAQNDLNKVPEQLRNSITSSTKSNDYYENGDYGDTDFFGTPPNFDNEEDNDDYDYEEDYSNNGFYLY